MSPKMVRFCHLSRVIAHIICSTAYSSSKIFVITVGAGVGSTFEPYGKLFSPKCYNFCANRYRFQMTSPAPTHQHFRSYRIAKTICFKEQPSLRKK